ncbi:hypothetical protein F2Q69_00048358 [Brassica cretica]|uniref:Uncharacterized protein n=1 Tax=Brassica cretica TaxID=69181 RepID=A0A8S9PRN6_BRACR|nr:hypothetical protein F2Q69_00048358 [Brassica cretica]
MNPRNMRRDIFLGIYRGTPFFGIYRGTCSSEYSEGPRFSEYSEGPRFSEFSEGPRFSEFSEGPVPWNFHRKFRGIFRRNFRGLDHRKVHRNIPTKFSLDIFRGAFQRTGGPRKFVSSKFRRKIPKDFRGKMNFRGVTYEDLFRRYVVGITLFRRHTDDFFPQYVAVFLY